MRNLIIIVILIVIIGGLFILWGPMESRVEQAKYTVVSQQCNIEIRDYAPMIIAETKVSGKRGKAANQGFRIIADFIFGNNSPVVLQESSEKIAMTAPVMEQSDDGKEWTISFVMPSEYTLETLPKPNNDAVTITEIPAKRFAVIRFSGTWSDKNVEKHEKELEAFIEAQDLTPLSLPIYAFYNPPWTVPFLRRNEVMIQIEE